uniref:H0815C01.6 protein n=1 Tax=Oryza sativa TaxID=4530 RepID=Q01J90_ORYSA|nr:H0815C01.6 [Oryza sativa]
MAAARLQPRRRDRLGVKGRLGASGRPQGRRQRGEERRIRRRHHRIRRPASATRRVAAGSGVSAAGSEPWWCGSTADAATPMARRPWLVGGGAEASRWRGDAASPASATAGGAGGHSRRSGATAVAGRRAAVAGSATRRPWLAGDGEAATAEIVPASWRLVAGLSWAAVVLVVVVTASWWFKAAGMAMVAGMASAEGAKAAVLVPARRWRGAQRRRRRCPQIRASRLDLEGSRLWWSETLADLRRLATAVGDDGAVAAAVGSDGVGRRRRRRTWRRHGEGRQRSGRWQWRRLAEVVAGGRDSGHRRHGGPGRLAEGVGDGCIWPTRHVLVEGSETGLAQRGAADGSGGRLGARGAGGGVGGRLGVRGAADGGRPDWRERRVRWRRPAWRRRPRCEEELLVGVARSSAHKGWPAGDAIAGVPHVGRACVVVEHRCVSRGSHPSRVIAGRKPSLGSFESRRMAVAVFPSLLFLKTSFWHLLGSDLSCVPLLV